MIKPPEKIVIRFCPDCGRNDRFVPFTGKGHFSAGQRCQGKLILVTYKPA